MLSSVAKADSITYTELDEGQVGRGLMDVVKLLAEYEEHHSRRAKGGIYALSGFDYQLRLHLAEYVAALAHATDTHAAGERFAHYLEALSDFAAQDPDRGTVFVQVKRTLTRKTLSDAAGEFAVIEGFLQTRLPAGELPRYQVVAQASELTSLPTWDEVALPPDLVVTHPDLAEQWTHIRRERRVATPRVERDPWWRLIASVFHIVDRPFAFARAALEVCLRRGERSATEIRDRIAELFTEARHAPSTFRALTSDDFRLVAPEDRKHLTVGHRPSLALLRDGQYMRRRQHVGAVGAGLERLLSARDNKVHHDLNVLWIAGRSGSGKSVVLLQVMQEMVERGFQVVWLEDDSARIQPMLQACHPDAVATDEDIPDLLFIDDLYDPRGQQSLDLDSIRRLISSASERPWPVVVTCGPPEFEERLKRESGGDCIQVQECLLAPVSRQEAGELQSWFRDRTGEKPQTASAFEQAEGLILSMAFEMRHGELRPFAARFRDRLRESSLAECLCVPLALNRLYISAPANWLTDREAERLDALNQDRDFSLLEAASAGRYLRLTHPHISDAIYEAIRTPATSLAYANDLAEAARRAMTSDTATLRQLLLVLATGDRHQRLDSVDLKRLAELVTADWMRSDLRNLARDGDAWADMWVSWACWDARQPELGLPRLLAGSPLTQARTALRTAGRIWPFVWERLAVAYPDDQELHGDAHRWLLQPRSEAAPAWSFIWERLWRRDPHSQAGHDRAALADCALSWLKRHENRAGWSHVWRGLLDEPQLPGTTRAELLSHAQAWLTGREDRPDWSHVWRQLLDEPQLSDTRRAELLASGQAWLAGREDQKDWNYVWEGLLATPSLSKSTRAELWARGQAWLVGREDEKNWAFVWRSLLNESELALERRADLLTSGHAWLAGREDRPEWNFVWKRLLDAPDLPATARAELLICGQAWLAGRGDRQEWNYVWKGLLDAAQLPELARLQLLASGQAWLPGREDGPQWSHVWERLLDAPQLSAEARPALWARANAWLVGREDRNDWAFVWQRLLDEPELPDATRADLLARGKVWLDGREQRPDWNFIWKRLLDAPQCPEPIRADLLARGHASLAGNEDRPGWNFVWKRLLNEPHLPEAMRADLLARGQAWLTRREEQQDWTYVWRRLFQDLDTCSETWSDDSHRQPFLSLGIAWTRQHPDHPQMPRLATEILRAASQPECLDDLAASLAKWVQQHPNEGASSFVYASLRPHFRTGHSQLAKLPGWSALLTWLGQPSRRTARKKRLKRQRVQQAEQRLATLREGEIVEGVVKRIEDFGVFVDLGGIDGLLPVREMSWDEVADPKVHCTEGQTVKVYVVGVDRTRRRVTVSLRRLTRSPWDAVEASLIPGARARGVVTHVQSYGAFVRLDCGLEGLVHASELSWDRDCARPESMLRVNQEVEVVVLQIDRAAEQISLSIRQTQPDPWDDFVARCSVGSAVEGRVVKLLPYGAFIRVEAGVQGLLHVEHLSWTKRVRHPQEMLSVGQFVRCKVLGMNGQDHRLDLGLRELTSDPWQERIPRAYRAGTVLAGPITRILPVGVFVQLEPELDGLVHRSRLLGQCPENLGSAFHVGQALCVQVLRVDVVRRRISLRQHPSGSPESPR